MPFDIAGARAAGYSDAEIASFLGSQTGFDVDGATKAGYKPDEIVGFLSDAASKGKDAPVDTSDPLTRVTPSTPANDDSTTFTAAAQPDAGSGRGFVNPPMANAPESIGDTATRMAKNAGSSVMSGFAKLGEGSALLTAGAATIYDKLHSVVSGKDETGAGDWVFGNSVDPAVAAEKYWTPTPEEAPSVADKIVNGLAEMGPTLLTAAATGGGVEAPTAVTYGLQAAKELLLHGMKTMSVAAFNSGLTRSAELIREGAPVDEAVKAGLVDAATTDLTGGVAMSAPGAKIATRALQGALVGATTGEVGRQAQNLALAPERQVPFTPEGLAVEAGTGAVLGATMAHPTVRVPDRIDIGYRPEKAPETTQERPNEPEQATEAPADPIAKIGAAQSVDEAIQAAQEAVQSAPVTVNTDSDLLKIRPLKEPDVSASTVVPAEPELADAGRVADSGAGVEPAVGDVGTVRPAVDAGGVRAAPEGDAVPLGAGQPEAVAPSFADRADGTLSVQGDPATVKALLNENGITSVIPNRDGVVVGKSQAEQARAILSDFQPEAPTGNPFKTFLIRNGVALHLASDFVPGTRERLAMGRTFRNGGLELDALAERAAEQGFIPSAQDTDALYDLISRVASGERVAPMYGHDAEAELRAQLDRHIAMEQDAASHLSSVPDAGLFALEDKSIPWDEPGNANTEDFLRAMGASEQEIKDAIADESARAQERAQGLGDAQETSGQQAAGADSARVEQARAAGRPDEEALTSPTPADIIAQQEARRLGEREEAQRRADEAAKAQADAERNEFALTGSDRAADANPNQGAMFRRGTEEGSKATQIQEAVSELTRDWLRKPDIHVLDSMADAPEPVRRVFDAQNSQGAVGHVEGFHWKGGVYLIGDALHSRGDVQRVLYHEALGHFGLRGVFGKSLDRALNEVATFLPREMRAKAAEYGFDLKDPRQRMQAAEEVLAEIAQTRPQMSVVRRAVAAIRTFLREHGFDTLNMTRDEIIRNFILPARGYVERGRNPEPSSVSSPAMFSRSKTAEAEAAPEEKESKPFPGSAVLDHIRNSTVVDDLLQHVAPMSTGSQKARAAAQTFANNMRVARNQWMRLSEHVKMTYTPEERKAMWDAADEQNTLMQQGKDTTGKGLDRLTPKQRATMQTLHSYASELWKRAQEVGLVEGEGLPFWTPRMAVMIGEDGSFSKPTGEGKQATSSGEGRNITTSAPSAKHRKYVTTEESEAALKAKKGDNAEYVHDILTMPLAMSRFEQAIAGRELINQVKEIGLATGKETVNSAGGPGFFTLDHPAFTSYKPRMVTDADGKVTPAKDQNGEMVFDRVPLFISKEFEGPLKAVMSHKDGAVYSGYMLLKSKAMTAIMASPLTHNMVIYGRALAYNPLKVGTGYLYWKGHMLARDNELMSKAIANGLVPIGANKNSMMDITDVARGLGREGGWGDPNESWVNLSMQKLGNAIHEGTGDAIKSKMDAMGDFVHHTLLWKQVGAIQIGIYNDMFQYLSAKGFSEKAAGPLAAHFANRYAGAVAQENMSEMARKAANVMLFSRSFNMGNLGAMKDVFGGMSAGLKAKMMEEVGQVEGSKALNYARRKAVASLLTEVGISVIAMSVVQSAVDRLKKDKSWSDIEQGYVRRLSSMFDNIRANPLDIKNYNPYQISPTWDNEPGKKDRIDMGEQPGGRHEYMRLPTGKVVEDMIGWAMEPGETFSKKMSPFAKSVWQDFTNDKGFGVPVKDPEGGFWKHAYDVSAHVATSQVPWDTIKNVYDLTQGKATDLDKDKLEGFATGFSYSQGHPQGPEGAVAAQTEERLNASRKYLMERVKDDLKYGNEDKARDRLEEIGLTPREITQIIRKVQEPRSGLSAYARKRFNAHANEDERKEMEKR